MNHTNQTGNQQIQTEGLIPQRWCNGCAQQTWVVTFEEAVEIAGISPNCYSEKVGKAVMISSVHIVTTSAGPSLICLKSLFHCIFTMCEAASWT